MTERYDAGLLGNGGGGDVEWWQNYIRHELDRAHEFYASEIEGLRSLLKSMLPHAEETLAMQFDMERHGLINNPRDGKFEYWREEESQKFDAAAAAVGYEPRYLYFRKETAEQVKETNDE
jgi:hypothetical protein